MLFNPSISIIIGNMYSGKSSELIRRLNIYSELGLNVLYVNSNYDTRSTTNISTHNKSLNTISLTFDTLKKSSLPTIEEYKKYDVIGIDESQFFQNLTEWCLNACEKENKIIICSGLNSTSERLPFGEILNLIAIADDVVKLHSYCVECKKENKIKPAIFSKRIVENKDAILIGAKEIYISVCRKYF